MGDKCCAGAANPIEMTGNRSVTRGNTPRIESDGWLSAVMFQSAALFLYCVCVQDEQLVMPHHFF